MLKKSIYHRQLLIYYLKEKSRLIEEKTGIRFIYDEDIEEVKKWTSTKIKKFFDNNNMFVNGSETISDMRACPWCYYYYTHYGYINCKWCGYGKRHGKCTSSKDTNTYREVTKKMIERGFIEEEGICTDKDIEKLITDIKELYNRILGNNLSREDLYKLENQS